MHDDDLEHVVAANARDSVLAEVRSLLARVRAGEIRATQRRNPFFSPGGPGEEWWRVPGEAFVNALVQRGLHKDEEFMSALKQGLEDAGKGAFFDFFTAIDGEGEWIGPRIRIQTTDGRPINGELHDAICRVWETRRDLED